MVNLHCSTKLLSLLLLSSLFEDIRELNGPLPPSTILCLTELYAVLRKVKVLIQECKDGSCLWNILQFEAISKQFHVLVKEMGMALDILSLKQVELLHKQIKWVDTFLDPIEFHRREELLQLMSNNNESKHGNKRISDCKKQIEMIEVLKLEGEARQQAGTGGLVVVSNINNLISLVSYSKAIIFGDAKYNEKTTSKLDYEAVVKRSVSLLRDIDLLPSTSQSIILHIPDKFRCSISLDLMRDPVIVASGHTYDRSPIAEWINSALIPNYALKCLIHQWSEENNIPLTSELSSSSEERSTSKRKVIENLVDHISASKDVIDVVKLTAEFLVGKLATGSPDTQRQSRMINRRLISEAGAIPFLVTLMQYTFSDAATLLLRLCKIGGEELTRRLLIHPHSIPSLQRLISDGSLKARRKAEALLKLLNRLCFQSPHSSSPISSQNSSLDSLE
ncbi:hypothetical protein MKW94_018070 [Papaver nudicaule]|uniref:RING-type E3 ubiquitin transferase n=1 Tax=Papaver nudicaule TaxID=74823 RepID=A0AA41SKR7_PAPNU|nr:hypothetical protein [Papaver nudicaule]